MSIYNARRIVRESLLMLLSVIPISICSGQLLHARLNLLLSVPAVLIVVPAFIDTVGDLASVFSARLTTALHIGFLEPRFRYSILIKNTAAIILISLIVFTFLGVVGNLIATALGLRGLGLVKGTFLTVTSGVVATLLMEIVATLTALGTYRYGWDPDNVTSPIVSTVGDVTGVLFLLLTLRFLGV